eukprot:88205-Pelagomonas_calceolata.AAC.2
MQGTCGHMQSARCYGLASHAGGGRWKRLTYGHCGVSHVDHGRSVRGQSLFCSYKPLMLL